MNVTVTGFGLNNAPWNQQAVVLGDTYDIIDYGKGPEGTAAVASETGHQITVNGLRGTGGNAYLLPWAPDTMCIGEVQQAHDLFFTYRLNGCGIIVSGGRSNPTVVHANTKSDAIPVTHDMQAMTAACRTIYQAWRPISPRSGSSIRRPAGCSCRATTAMPGWPRCSARGAAASGGSTQRSAAPARPPRFRSGLDRAQARSAASPTTTSSA